MERCVREKGKKEVSHVIHVTLAEKSKSVYTRTRTETEKGDKIHTKVHYELYEVHCMNCIKYTNERQ